jgi:hypothetical protein
MDNQGAFNWSVSVREKIIEPEEIGLNKERCNIQEKEAL